MKDHIVNINTNEYCLTRDKNRSSRIATGERRTRLLQKQHNGIGKLAWQQACCHGNLVTAH